MMSNKITLGTIVNIGITLFAIIIITWYSIKSIEAGIKNGKITVGFMYNSIKY